MEEVTKSVSQWAKSEGIAERTARDWFKRVGYKDDGSLLLGFKKGRGVQISEKEWQRVKAEGALKRGIPKGFKYSEAALAGRYKDSETN